MFAKNLKCVDCSAEFELLNYYNCPQCGGILEAKYHEDKLYKAIRNIGNGNKESLWRYFDLLPVKEKSAVVSIGEGMTSLVRGRNLHRAENYTNIYYKLEMNNPTGSFKDRPTSVGISKAKELGLQFTVIASSGNAGAAAAAYSARARLPCVIFIPELTPTNKLLQIPAYGAKVIKVTGNYSNAYAIAKEISESQGAANLTSTYLNPYTVEADKTVAYELWEQLGGKIPDCILVPVGSGPLLFGVLKGFKELRGAGLIQKLPKMVCLQGEGCAPIFRAWQARVDQVSAWPEPPVGVASGINDPLVGYSQDGTATLKAVKESKGVVLSVNDSDILEATGALAVNEGIFAETTAGISEAGVKKLIDNGYIDRDALVVALITGHGLKTPDALADDFQNIPTISNAREYEMYGG